MIDKEFVETLVCPQNRTPLRLADAPLVAKLNRAIAAGRIVNRAGRPVEDSFQAALVRQDRAMLYPIVDDIPVLLAEEAIALDQLDGGR
ncbi:MAG: hypothetical protein ABSG86_27830 [Thermoguttaceae bacterium]|jgi:uncharacterized protein YbaR (Trm112 family)